MGKSLQIDFEKLFEKMPGCYLILSPELNILAATNDYFTATLASKEKIIGLNMFEAFPDNPNDTEATGTKNLRASLDRVLRDKRPDAMAVQKYDVPKPDSPSGEFEERYWSPLNSPVFDDKGNILYIIHRVENVTEFIQLKQMGKALQENQEEMESQIYSRAQQLQEANQRLRDTHAKLKESERLKDEFLAKISHELRTPLTLILAPLESLLAKRGAELTSSEWDLIATMHNNSLRLFQMINGLLDFSKLEAGNLKSLPEPAEISSLTRIILSDFEPLVQKKEITLNFSSEFNDKIVSIDRYIFERILFNLLSNAIKFTPAGGRIDVNLVPLGDRLILTVEDTGIGIPESSIETIFQKFRQVEEASTRRFEGSGLGLALVKEFAALMGGTISVRSEVNNGSAFTVEIEAPTVRLKEGVELPKNIRSGFFKNTASLESQTGTSENLTPNSNFKVLIAEDNSELAQYISTLLSGLCQTYITGDGAQALNAARSWKPDLILSDVMMPNVDGLELARKIKSDSALSNIPVVLLTALTHQDALLKGWESGADEYLFKPFHPQELTVRIKSMLALVEARRQREHESKRRKELEEFAYIASHDLKEPMRTISVYTEKLQQTLNIPDEAEGKKWLEFTLAAVKRMQILVRDLIRYSVVDREDGPIELTDSNACLAEAVQNLQASIFESGATLTHDDLPGVRAVPSQLTQLFQNLIGNALKYRSKEAPRIHITSKRLANDLIFSIKDNGIGFDPEYAERIFIIFKRLHNKDEYSGTGIGLAICKKIVEKHGGRIWANSAPGNGSNFQFSFPA